MKESDTKLIFGLNPFYTLLNSVLLLILSSLLNAVYFCKHVDENAINFDRLVVDNPWYISWPLFVVSWLMFIKFLEWRFVLSSNPLTFTLKSVGIKIGFLFVFVFFESFFKYIFIKQLIEII